MPASSATSARGMPPDPGDGGSTGGGGGGTGNGKEKHGAESILLGSLVGCCQILNDLEGKPGAFFVLSDLGVRSSGTYRLRFDLFDLSAIDGDRATAISSATTGAFTVFAPKAFPGMTGKLVERTKRDVRAILNFAFHETESTKLTRCFARQGVKLFVRSEFDAIPAQSQASFD
ncbi:hypothetical protein HK101_004124 [Irineochytrium annulatum]|nr:hypothetical protein HK101_004124 [Irineochytrium annulatum]